MPVEYCISCGAPQNWRWEEAFDKFGFNDGEGMIRTGEVAVCLRGAGLVIETEHWRLHNVIITSIKRDDEELLPFHRENFRPGYGDPRSYLPADLVELLDRTFSEEEADHTQ